MAEVVNVAVAFLVIVFIFRWATTPGEQSEADKALGFRPKKATQPMVDTVAAMFPDIPVDNIRYDLLRTGSVETTSNRILERGFLDPPPAGYFTLYPRSTDTSASQIRQSAPAPGTPQPGSSTPKQTLISKFNLETRVNNESISQEDIGGKSTWEDSAEKREASLRERKAKMILAARQRMLQKEAGNSPSPSS
ncbi:hypothetical protein CYLTODRAFT_427659 [Cylindrobasidium torrendii FP15055 ss-10]|uniref:CUE domain-containing protein n=1 Tax=Cylindrobasidium torrendii FP15055 ss-10 TaxID=1314674 RepID=A0A0D7ATM6_9AGAR|nr:hypothetical protein CYLTODRAFT_427659 [Cylindrobasidium torrendii FP15055 ss-10]